MLHRVTVLPQQQNINAAPGENLLEILRREGFFLDAPCGGNGSCGKCKVLADGVEVLACQTAVDKDLTVTLPDAQSITAVTKTTLPEDMQCDHGGGYLLAFDIGTTTVAAYLLDGTTGRELVCESAQNPQAAYGADVISRIQHALNGRMDVLTAAIRDCVDTLARKLCETAGIPPEQVRAVSIVGNPTMQQLFLGILPKNLAQLPFDPVLTQAKTVHAGDYLPCCENADLLIVPDISGFVGADTVAGILATGMAEAESLTLLVDIGTNGEMVLGNRYHMVACSTAAGPALEGAGIRFGMRGQPGAIDHVWVENGKLTCSVIGGGEATGICGSGLIDAAAVALDLSLINERGKVLTEGRHIALTEQVFLTQEDIRQLQLAKGAIAAGIELMMACLDITAEDIEKVYLAGAFGTFMDPASACRIGLLPAELEEKIEAVGNAAGSGAKRLACNKQLRTRAQILTEQTEFLELASVAEFSRTFAKNMRFDSAQSYWCKKALALGFSHAVPMEPNTLQPRQEVRDMCAEDKCRAYGKNWMCPPNCGELSQCEEKIGSYTRGILLQTVGKTEKAIDTKAYRRTEALHLKLFYGLAEEVRARHPGALCLGSGGCRICEKCAFPEPCRFPEKACASMEAYGLFVSHVCRDNDLPYHHGEGTITYTACILF